MGIGAPREGPEGVSPDDLKGWTSQQVSKASSGIGLGLVKQLDDESMLSHVPIEVYCLFRLRCTAGCGCCPLLHASCTSAWLRSCCSMRSCQRWSFTPAGRRCPWGLRLSTAACLDGTLGCSKRNNLETAQRPQLHLSRHVACSSMESAANTSHGCRVWYLFRSCGRSWY